MKPKEPTPIVRDAYIFELEDDATLNYLVHFAAPFTGGDSINVPAGLKFSPHQRMRSDAFYMHIIGDMPKDLELSMKAKVSQTYPDLATRLQGFSFYITEEQVKTLPLRFIKGTSESLLDIFRKNIEYSEAMKHYDPFKDPEWLKKEFGSTYEELEKAGVPKMLDTPTTVCPECGGKLRPVYWGELTPDIEKQKKEGKIFIGEVLYGKDSHTDYKKKYGDYKIIQSTNQSNHPDFACGDCGCSFILRNNNEKNLPLISKIREKLKNLF